MIEPKDYGRALFMLSEERGTSQAVMQDLTSVRQALHDNPSYGHLMDTPAVALPEKEGLIDAAFASVDTDVRSFLKILASKHAFFAFYDAASFYETLYEESRGIARAEAVSAVAMTEAQRTALCNKLSRMTGKRILLKNTVDPTVIGGMKLRYLGKQIDGTLASRLSGLEAAVKNTIVE